MQKKKTLKYNVNHEEWTCPMCKKKFVSFGNNPEPFDFNGKVVCDICNVNVIKERLFLASKER